MRRRPVPQPPPLPEPCGCAGQITALEQRAGELEQTTAALAVVILMLRPRLPFHSPAQGLISYGVKPAAAEAIARAAARQP